MKFMDRLRNFIAARKRTEEGAGSISLMVASLAVTIMAGMALTSATLSLSTTYDQLSQRQADAAVDLALNDAVNIMNAGNCFIAQSNSPDGKWRWQIFKTKNEQMPMDNNEPNVYSGCPTYEDKWVLIVATGKGRENTLSKKIAVYKTYGTASTKKPEIIIGDTGSRAIPQAITGKKIVLNNNKKIEQDPGVTGSNGSMYVGSEGLTCDNSEMKINVSSVKGTASDQLTNCPVYGDFNSQKTSNFGANSYLYGDLCSTVSVASESAPMIKGNLKNADASCASKVKGTFYGYLPDPRDGIKFTGTQCSDWSTMSAKIMGMKGDENMADLRDCPAAQINSSLNTTSAKELEIQGNITILLNEGSNVKNLEISSVDGKPYTLSFATPSPLSSISESKCGVPGSTNTYNNITYGSGTSGVLYSACSLTVSNSIINGQVYAGETLTMSSSSLNYSLVELPYAFRSVKDIGKGSQLIRVY